jgi:hypothetical protein
MFLPSPPRPRRQLLHFLGKERAYIHGINPRKETREILVELHACVHNTYVQRRGNGNFVARDKLQCLRLSSFRGFFLFLEPGNNSVTTNFLTFILQNQVNKQTDLDSFTIHLFFVSLTLLECVRSFPYDLRPV